MRRPNPPRRYTNPWPQKIKDWLENDAYHSGEEPAIRLALLTDPRLSDVATKLSSAEHNDDLQVFDDNEVSEFPDGNLHAFLDRMLAIPGTWRFLSPRSRDFVVEELADLRDASVRYEAVLRKHRVLAELYLSGWTEISPEKLDHGKRRFDELTRSIETIRGLAVAGHHLFAPGDLPDLGRKRKYKEPKRGLMIFFVRQLAEHAQRILGEDLYDEIALLATVCLELDEPIGRGEVRELCSPERVARWKSDTKAKE